MKGSISPRRSIFVQAALAALCLACACASAGCLTPRVLSLARGEKMEGYRARIESVTRAAQRESGALVLCVETLSTLQSREQVHVEVPLDRLTALREHTSLEFGLDGGFDSSASRETAALRYVFFADQLRPGCPDAGKELPIRAVSTDGPAEAGIYASAAEEGMKVRYHSAEPLWSSVHDLDLAPVLGGQAVQSGSPQPLYWAVLPFAMLFDGLLAFLYLRP